MFAYVSEQHPFVDKVLRGYSRLMWAVVDSFTGYQSDAGEVYRQVYSRPGVAGAATCATAASRSRRPTIKRVEPARAPDRRVHQQRPGELRRRQRAVGVAVLPRWGSSGARLRAGAVVPGVLYRSQGEAPGRPGNHADRIRWRRRRQAVAGPQRCGRCRSQQPLGEPFGPAVIMGATTWKRSNRNSRPTTIPTINWCRLRSIGSWGFCRSPSTRARPFRRSEQTTTTNSDAGRGLSRWRGAKNRRERRLTSARRLLHQGVTMKQWPGARGVWPLGPAVFLPPTAHFCFGDRCSPAGT